MKAAAHLYFERITLSFAIHVLSSIRHKSSYETISRQKPPCLVFEWAITYRGLVSLNFKIEIGDSFLVYA